MFSLKLTFLVHWAQKRAVTLCLGVPFKVISRFRTSWSRESRSLQLQDPLAVLALTPVATLQWIHLGHPRSGPFDYTVRDSNLDASCRFGSEERKKIH